MAFDREVVLEAFAADLETVVYASLLDLAVDAEDLLDARRELAVYFEFEMLIRVDFAWLLMVDLAEATEAREVASWSFALARDEDR